MTVRRSRTRLTAAGVFLTVGLLISACSVTRPLALNLDPTSLEGYLAEHPTSNLHVRTRAGDGTGCMLPGSGGIPWWAAGGTTFPPGPSPCP